MTTSTDVATANPNDAFMAKMSTLATNDLVDLLVQTREALALAKLHSQTLEAIVRQRMADERATLKYAGDYKVTIEQPMDNEVRLNELHNLEALVPAPVLREALWLEVPEPYHKWHITKLRALAKLGSEVSAILDKAIVRVPKGAPKLVITEIEKPQHNVTGTASEQLPAHTKVSHA